MSVQARSYVQLIMGGRVPVDTTPGPVLMYRALKKSPPQLMSCPQRVSQQVQLWKHNCQTEVPAALPEVESSVPVGRSAARTPPPPRPWWQASGSVERRSRCARHRCQSCSDRLLLVSPRAQSSLPATLSSSHHGLPARLGHEKMSNSRAKQGSPNLSEPGGGGGSDAVLMTYLCRQRTTRMHLIVGRHVPVDMAPSGPVLVYRAPNKVYPASQLSRPTAGPHRCMTTHRARTAPAAPVVPCSRPATVGLHSFLHCRPSSICCCTPTGMSTTASKLHRAATVGSSTVSLPPAPEESAGPAHRDVEHLVKRTATGESQWSAELDQGKRPLRHDSDVNDLDLHNDGHVNQFKMHSLALYVPVSA